MLHKVRNSIIFAIALLIASSSWAQILKPISWQERLSNKTPEVGEVIEIIFEAKIDKNWYLYSNDFDPDLGPMLTEFEFDENETYELVGEPKPINPISKYDDIWEGDVSVFIGKGEFRQKIKILKESFHISGTYDYQVCSDIDGKCIPFEEDFSFKGKNTASSSKSTKAGVPAEQNQQAYDNDKTESKEEKNTSNSKKTEEVSADLKKTEETKKERERILLQRDESDPYTLLGFMLFAFLGGLAALLTPCVFPMIPLTVSFFTNKGGSRAEAIFKAAFYGISIVVIYVLAGTVVAAINGPEFANWLSTHWVPNVFFFLVFFIFALSFFGLFEINLPSSFVNKMDAQADKSKGLLGVFFMAFTLVLVSFSCTGPIVGSILVESAGGQVIKPLVGMFGFSMAFAIPFTLFAIFPEWLNNLPKSGGWLNSVKVVLGFLELALGLKFLSVADQVYHWGILDRETYLAFWIVIFFLLGMYLLGKLRLPHDSPVEKVSVPRLVMAILTFSFVVYLIPGMFGAPLKSLAGYLPPMSTHDFDMPGIVRQSGGDSMVYTEDGLCDPPKYADMLHLPHGLKGYFDYRQALECARSQDKPLFIDFTGHGCVNCREMEARVWSDPEVLRRLQNDFVIVALYVDEKVTLPEDEWYTSEYDGKVKKTIGKQNADFQITRFNNNAQPFYIILDNEEELLHTPVAYDLKVSNFVKFLDDAKARFDERK